MTWFSDLTPIPAGYRTAEFILRPLKPEDVELDYDAVMESAEALRLGSQGRWPSEGFTLEENLQDLVWHDDEHRKGIAFTYTVMSPDEKVCLGCVYVKDLFVSFEAAGFEGEIPDPADGKYAKVSFWVRTSRLEEGLDQRLFSALQAWFRTEWPIRQVFFELSAWEEGRRARFEAAGLRVRYALDYPRQPGKYLIYSR